ncbi:hypothetical protein BZK31_26940 [Pseudomonas floridensis]|uniref:Uncharacterized protein n=1 Tax=Pseudomonas floridensis TaxID=1958950 RepID=A0A1X0MYT7_9PSED|nr:hypothetical protein [Pseudomonas floridensis]ORC53883.1 hypothetical protein BZK31_26940 [Pseudomonas floridensis]
MSYGFLSGFIYDVADSVGEFLSDEQKRELPPPSLEEIVKTYIDKRNLLSAFCLRLQIKKYIKEYTSPHGLEYVDPPFNQETSFPEDYFEGDLYVFLTNTLTFLNREIKARRLAFFRKLMYRN